MVVCYSVLYLCIVTCVVCTFVLTSHYRKDKKWTWLANIRAERKLQLSQAWMNCTFVMVWNRGRAKSDCYYIQYLFMKTTFMAATMHTYQFQIQDLEKSLGHQTTQVGLLGKQLHGVSDSKSTVVPLYSDHPWNHVNVVLYRRWSYYKGAMAHKIELCEKNRWSYNQGGL